MKKDKRLYVTAASVVALLLWLGLRKSEDSSSTTASGSAAQKQHREVMTDRSESSSSSLTTKLSVRPEEKKVAPADAKQTAEFRRFFLPPLDFKNATLEEAIATLLKAYSDASEVMGGEPLNLQIDLSKANRDIRITCTTPRGTIGPILQYLAAQAGNGVKGALPEFKLVALDQNRDRSGTRDVDFSALAKLNHPKGPTGSSEPGSYDDTMSTMAVLTALKIGDSTGEINFQGSSLSYKNLSAADEAKLDAVLAVSDNGGLGPGQAKLSVRVVETLDPMDNLENGKFLDQAGLQDEMRRLAEKKGTDLISLPAATARTGETNSIEILRDGTSADAETGWTGVKVSATSVPLGLGHEATVHFENRPQDQPPVIVDHQLNVPDSGSGVMIQRGADGTNLLILPSLTLIDGRGMPVSQWFLEEAMNGSGK